MAAVARLTCWLGFERELAHARLTRIKVVAAETFETRANDGFLAQVAIDSRMSWARWLRHYCLQLLRWLASLLRQKCEWLLLRLWRRHLSSHT